MLKTNNISYTIGNKKILQEISADFRPGELTMILGPNGSGKSSFLKIFSGELSRYEGTVLYDGKQLNAIRKEELAKYRAVMSQQPELSFPLTVEEVVMMGRYPHFTFQPGKKDQAVCDEVFSKMKLEPFRERNYLTLSGGEKQRVQFARVLAQIWQQPGSGQHYLFLDEPLASLDINYQQEFLHVARDFAKAGAVVVVVIHDINLAIQFADQLLFFHQGNLLTQGRPRDIITTELIQAIFGVKTRIIENPFSGFPLIVFE